MNNNCFSLFCVTLFLFLFACDEKDEPVIVPEIKLEGNSSYSFSSDAGESEITFTTTQAWDIISDASWVDIYPKSGEAGKSTIFLSIEQNHTYVVREATLTIVCGSVEDSVLITQSKKTSFIPSDTEQAFFMYLPWGSNLLPYFETNIADLEKAIKKRGLVNEQVLVYLNTSPTEATLFEIKYENGDCLRNTLKEYSNPAFTTAEGITSILNDVIEYAPADRYAMSIGCHGMGWIPVDNSSRSMRSFSHEKEYWEYESVFQTRWFGGLTAEYQTDITTLAEGIRGAGIKMEYILFDDCYMSSLEAAFDLREVTDHVIACPTEIMIFGMPYEEIGQYMLGDVDYEGLCNAFLLFYQNYYAPYATIGVTVCSELEAMAVIMKEINEQYEFDTSLLNSIQRMDGYTPGRFFDFGDYVTHLCADKELLARFNEQLERSNPYKYRKHTDYYFSMSGINYYYINTYTGVTISDPSVSSYTSAKAETAWYKATH